MLTRMIVAAALLLGGCAAPASPQSSSPSHSPEGESLAAPSAEPNSEKRFDDLTLTLELESETVESGAEFSGEMLIQNHSDHDIVDPGCWLEASSAGVVPPDDPAGELWLQVVVDCAGRSTVPAGAERRNVITFVAATKFGDPLPPGDYVAAVEYRGLSRRVEAPVTIVE